MKYLLIILMFLSQVSQAAPPMVGEIDVDDDVRVVVIRISPSCQFKIIVIANYANSVNRILKIGNCPKVVNISEWAEQASK